MARISRDIDIILSNMTGIFLIMTVLMTVMAIVCFWLGEEQYVGGFFYAFLLSAALTISLWLLYPKRDDIELRHAMILAALAYLAVPAISAIPYISIQGMTPLDAYLEAMSGWTGTGLSMISKPEDCTHIIQLWRSMTQWLAGIGVIVLVVAILIRPGTSTYFLYQSETRKEKIHPSIQSTINTIWFLYLGLTVVAISIFAVAGMPLWDALNHAMTTISTGGFSVYSDSIAHYDNPVIEAAVIPVMLLGAVPFVVIYHAIKGKGKRMDIFRDVQVKMLFKIIGLLAIGLIIENFLFFNDAFASIRYSVFQVVSAITTTGFQTADISGWPQTALLILSIAAIIGGCAGSTTGGLKVARAIFLTSEVNLWIKKTLLSRHAIATVKLGDKRVTEDIINKELAEATLISFLWILGILIGVIVMSHVLPPGIDFSRILFEVCSIQGNVGMSCGIATPSLHIIGKVSLILSMWVGRLEIIPVILFVRYIVKGLKL